MSALSNSSDCNTNCVGTSNVQDNLKDEIIIKKGSYSSNILFPVLTAHSTTTTTTETCTKTNKKNNVSSCIPKKPSSKIINKVESKFSSRSSNINIINNKHQSQSRNCLDNNNKKKNSVLYPPKSCTKDNSGNLGQNFMYSTMVYHFEEDILPEKVPSFFNRILAPPTAFADDSRRKIKEADFFGIDQRIEESPIEGNSLTTIKSLSVENSIDNHIYNQFYQQQDQHFPLTTSGRNLNIFSPTSTTHSSNFSSFLHPEEFSYPSFDFMMKQPDKMKRVRSDTDNNNTGYSATDESETDEEMRVIHHLHHNNKRSRDVSPVKSTQKITDFSKLSNGDCQALTSNSSIQAPELSQNQYRDFGSTTSTTTITTEPSSSLSSENYHSTSVISTTTGHEYPGLDTSHHLSDKKIMMFETKDNDDEEDTYNLPAECFLSPNGNVIFTQNSSSDDTHFNPQPIPVPEIQNFTRAQEYTCVQMTGVVEEGISSSSSLSSVTVASTTLQGVRITGGARSVQRFKGPRVPTACKRSPVKKHHASYSYTMIKSVKNPKQIATSMGKDVNETDEDDEEDSEFDGNADDTTIRLKLSGDEAIEDDASTSTDITLPNIIRSIVPPIRPSYFPNVPPYINFCLHDEKSESLPAEIRKHLKWRMSTITPVVIRKTVGNSGFRLLKNTIAWGGQWGKHMKATMFRSSVKDFQKLNHLPGTFQIGRKDRLWKNIYRFMLKYGKAQFGFLPRTYILPHDMKQLKHAFESGESTWIVKPPAGARGTGIRVINKWGQVPKKRPMIVQSYITKPLLINDRKFDLRLYVLVTSFHPLKVYLYDDGLVRFAPIKYSHDSKRVGDRFMHLTNYSINKNCDLYTQNEDANSAKGHKWTLKTLWRYLRAQGTETTSVMKRIEDIVIKTLISAEECITSSCGQMNNRYNGYELFGFDIILDENFKPWLLEVNISPSLHSSSPLDLAVKGQLVKEVFNIVGYHLPPASLPTKQAKNIFIERLDKDLELDKPTFDKRIYTTVTTKEEKTKQQMFKAKCDDRVQYVDSILDSLTSDDIRQLIIAEDELSQCSGFNRIFPTRNTHAYFAFFEGSPRYYNMLMDAWENKYEENRAPAIRRLQELCRRKIHLISAPTPAATNLTSDNQEETTEVVQGEKNLDLSSESSEASVPNNTAICSTPGMDYSSCTPMSAHNQNQLHFLPNQIGDSFQYQNGDSFQYEHGDIQQTKFNKNSEYYHNDFSNSTNSTAKIVQEGHSPRLIQPQQLDFHSSHPLPNNSIGVKENEENRINSNLINNSNAVGNNNNSNSNTPVNEYNKISLCF